MKQKKIEKVLKVATDLITKNGSTTTLDIKNECRSRYPKKKWYQDDISDVMDAAYHNQDITNLRYNPNAQYRTYFVVTPINTSMQVQTQPQQVQNVKNNVKKVSRTELVRIIRDESKGRFMTLSWVKNDGSDRTANGQIKRDAFMTTLGYIIFRTPTDGIKNVEPKTVHQLKLGGVTYVV